MAILLLLKALVGSSATELRKETSFGGVEHAPTFRVERDFPTY